MPRSIWKGAISFGLVHVPVALYPASSETGIDFDWLDRRTMDPVGYKRINKRTGREIAKDDIVRGVKVDGDRYVVLGDDEIRAAYPRTMQTIEIESFVNASEVPFTHLDRPYYLEPVARGEKVYTLLRQALIEAGVIGIARVVMHTKEHLAALVPTGPALMLVTLRWAREIRPWTDLKLPDEGAKTLKPTELQMAKKLVEEMTAPWDASKFEDHFTAAVQALVDRRAEAGETESVEPMEEAPAGGSNVVDLTALLQRSLGQRPGRKAAADDGDDDGDEAAPTKAGGAKPAAKKVASKATGKAAAKKSASSRATSERKRA